MIENTEHKIGLISPSEALNRFVPSEQFDVLWMEHETEQVRYGFRAGNTGLIIDANRGSEVINEFALCAIPNTPAWFSGMINLRGNMVPVFNLNELFGTGDKDHDQQRILIMGEGDEAAGILIDRLPQVLRALDESSELPSVPEILRKHVTTIFKQDNDIWLCFNFEGFFMDLGRQITA